MTAYQAFWRSMDTKERFANKIICWFKVDEEGYASRKSRWNKALYKMYNLIFREDLFDVFVRYTTRMNELQIIERYPYEDAMADVAVLKEAYK